MFTSFTSEQINASFPIHLAKIVIVNVQLKCLGPVQVRCSEKKKKRRDKETETILERGTFLYLGRILIRQKLSNPVKAYQRLSFAITSNARKWGGARVRHTCSKQNHSKSWFRENCEKKSQISPQMTKVSAIHLFKIKSHLPHTQSQPRWPWPLHVSSVTRFCRHLKIKSDPTMLKSLLAKLF